jgi:hypothetical protein
VEGELGFGESIKITHGAKERGKKKNNYNNTRKVDIKRERLQKLEKLNLLKSQNSEWKKKRGAERDRICFIRERKGERERERERGRRSDDESSSCDWFLFLFLFFNLILI